MLLSRVWNKAFTHSNVMSGFYACGLFPLDRDAPLSSEKFGVLTAEQLAAERLELAIGHVCSTASLIDVDAPHPSRDDQEAFWDVFPADADPEQPFEFPGEVAETPAAVTSAASDERAASSATSNSLDLLLAVIGDHLEKMGERYERWKKTATKTGRRRVRRVNGGAVTEEDSQRQLAAEDEQLAQLEARRQARIDRANRSRAPTTARRRAPLTETSANELREPEAETLAPRAKKPRRAGRENGAAVHGGAEDEANGASCSSMERIAAAARTCPPSNRLRIRRFNIDGELIVD